MVLDLGLPDEDGLDVLERLRARDEQVPVVILTARGEVEDRIAGSRAGRRRLRLKAVLDRRARGASARPRADVGEIVTKLRAGDVELDLVTRVVLVGRAATVELTAREFSLLETLMREPERPHPATSSSSGCGA